MMLNPEEQLAAVAEELAQYRRNKTHQREKVPMSLRNKILDLQEHFDGARLRGTLNFNRDLWRRWNAVREQQARTAPDVNAAFIPLPPVEQTAQSQLELALQLGEQCRLCLIGEFSVEHLDVFTRNIFMYQNGRKT